MLRAFVPFEGSMGVDDRAHGARNIVAKTSVIQRAHCKCSAVYGVLLFMNAGPSGLGWCVCCTGECTCACVEYELCHLTVDSNLPFDA